MDPQRRPLRTWHLPGLSPNFRGLRCAIRSMYANQKTQTRFRTLPAANIYHSPLSSPPSPPLGLNLFIVSVLSPSQTLAAFLPAPTVHSTLDARTHSLFILDGDARDRPARPARARVPYHLRAEIPARKAAHRIRHRGGVFVPAACEQPQGGGYWVGVRPRGRRGNVEKWGHGARGNR